jgi:carbon monoxide dehydrogenase subunit G
MQFENHFEVDAPLEQVWNAVLDVERVAPTVPGAQVLEQTAENAYKVGIKVKVGPMSMTYKGEVEITERDEDAHRAVMKARAKESRGQGTADADVTMTLTGDNGRTSATITTDVELSGKAAAMGQGVIQDVAGRMVDTFAKNLATMLEGGGEATTETSDPAPDEAAGAAATPSGGEAARAASAAGGDGGAPKFDGGEDALDLGELGGAMLADRLKDPRIVAVIAIVAFLLGRRSAR